jgi:hypothetical protein
MAVNDSHTASLTVGNESGGSGALTDDRYCRACSEIALAYDPSANRARCRSCGELA